MLFTKSKNSDEKKWLTQSTDSPMQTTTTNISTWLTELGCHSNSFGGTSIVANSINITIVGAARKSSQYWYSDDLSSNGARGLLAHYNQNGGLISTQILSWSDDYLGLTSIIASANNEIVVGWSSNGIWTAKFNLVGDLLWAKALSSDNWENNYFSKTPMSFLTKNNYGITTTAVYSDGSYAIPIYNLNDDGSLLWAIAIKNDTLKSMYVSAITSSADDGSATIVGSLSFDGSMGYSYTPFIATFSKYGKILNSTQFFLNANDLYQDWSIAAITPADDQGYFAVGYYYSSYSNNGQMLTLHMDSNGRPLSAVGLLNTVSSTISAVVSAANASYAIVGSISNDGESCLVGLLDSRSMPIWMTAITHSRGIYCTGVTNSRDGGFVVTGSATEKIEKYYSANRAITIKINEAGFIADADMPSGFTYNDITNQFSCQPLVVQGVDLIWTVENQLINVTDITSSISISTDSEFCDTNLNLRLLWIFLSILVTMGLCRLGWQDEKRKAKSPWQGSTSEHVDQQKKHSVDNRKSSLSGGGLFGLRRLAEFSTNAKDSRVGIVKRGVTASN